jgi:hypothetical protein
MATPKSKMSMAEYYKRSREGEWLRTGMGIFLRDFDAVWNEVNLRRRLLDIIALTEGEESILGVSPHLLAVARKPASRIERKKK